MLITLFIWIKYSTRHLKMTIPQTFPKVRFGVLINTMATLYIKIKWTCSLCSNWNPQSSTMQRWFFFLKIIPCHSHPQKILWKTWKFEINISRAVKNLFLGNWKIWATYSTKFSMFDLFVTDSTSRCISDSKTLLPSAGTSRPPLFLTFLIDFSLIVIYRYCRIHKYYIVPM